VTRTLKGLLIAVTLGAVVVLVWRARKPRGSAAPETEAALAAGGSPAVAALPSGAAAVAVADHGPERIRESRASRSAKPVRASASGAVDRSSEYAVDRSVAKPVERSGGQPLGSSTGQRLDEAGRLPFEPAEVAGAPRPGVPTTRHVPDAEPAAIGSATGGSAGDAAGPVVVLGAPTEPRRRRGVRSPVGVGVLALALIAAAIGGTVAYRGMTGDKAEAVASTANETSAGTPGASSGQPKGAAPQQFTKVSVKSGGTLEKTTLAGAKSGVTADVWVWLPPGYDAPANQARRYPVLVAQSALPGVDANSFVDDSVAFLPKLAAAIEAGTVPPYIVVAPELMPYTKQEADAGRTAAKDTECSDIPNRPKMATFHNDDVRDAVLSTYRAAADRASWALIGDGSGGLCAVKYALQYPQYYAAAVSLSGRTTLKSPLWATEAQAKTANDPVKLLAGRPDVRILLSGHSGTTGSDFADAAVAPTTVKALPGASASSTDITRQLPDAWTFLSRNTRNPAA
jgi:enterochelin esterase-like enzyme